jgi:uncharacterized membrane protein YoaK (UPF0700 family)
LRDVSPFSGWTRLHTARNLNSAPVVRPDIPVSGVSPDLFAAHAHSLKQKARLAISLSWIAGFTNVITLLACGQATSHVTGSTSMIGRSVAEWRIAEAAYLMMVVVFFYSGALLSGVLTEFGRLRRWDSIFVLPMTVEAVLLATFALLIDWRTLGTLTGEAGRVWLTFVPAAAMGLQNATITRISDGVVRTTHVTGVITDLGIETATLIMRRQYGKQAHKSAPDGGTLHRAALLASIAASFAVGACLGTLAWQRIPQWSMLPAVAFLIWIVWQDLRNPIASVRTNRDVGGSLHESLPPEIAVYHVRAKGRIANRRSRLPNLVVWADHLSNNTKVVVLDLSEAALSSSNEFLEIRSLADKLAANDIELILAGVNDAHYAAICRTGLHRAIPSSRIRASLDEAVDLAMRMHKQPADPG